MMDPPIFLSEQIKLMMMIMCNIHKRPLSVTDSTSKHTGVTSWGTGALAPPPGAGTCRPTPIWQFLYLRITPTGTAS